MTTNYFSAQVCIVAKTATTVRVLGMRSDLFSLKGFGVSNRLQMLGAGDAFAEWPKALLLR